MKKKTGAKILIIIFTAFIAVMGMLYIFMPKTEFSETEKRYLMSAPKLTLSNIKDGSFSEDFETFLADQTPLRTLFVSINAYFELDESKALTTRSNLLCRERKSYRIFNSIFFG